MRRKWKRNLRRCDKAKKSPAVPGGGLLLYGCFLLPEWEAVRTKQTSDAYALNRAAEIAEGQVSGLQSAAGNRWFGSGNIREIVKRILISFVICDILIQNRFEKGVCHGSA